MSNDFIESDNARLSDQAYGAIRSLIIECRLAPGSAVSEPELSAKLGQNRAGVRAALLRLSQQGLVRPVPRRGYVVSPLTLRDAHDIFGMRLLLEPPAAAEAAGRLDASAFRDVERAFASGYRRGDTRSTAAFLRANRAFRVIIAGAGGNRRLADAVAGLVDESERYLLLSLLPADRSREMLSGYRDLVAAVVGGEGSRAEAISRGQIETARARVIEALMAHPALIDMPVGIPATVGS